MGIGEALAEARGQAGLTVTEVSRRTRIGETTIRGIEGGDYSACGGDFDVRANIRSIAEAVGADPEPLIREYDEARGAPGTRPEVSLDELFTSAQMSGRRRMGWTPVLGLGLVIISGRLGYAFLSGPPRVASIPAAAADHEATRAGPSKTPDHPATVAPTVRPTVPARTLPGPAATVAAFVAAINAHDPPERKRGEHRDTARAHATCSSGSLGLHGSSLAPGNLVWFPSPSRFAVRPLPPHRTNALSPVSHLA